MSYPFSIDVKQIECQDVRNYWKYLYNNPGTYRWYGKTCTTTATKSFIEAGIYDGGMVRKPVTLMKKLKVSNTHVVVKKGVLLMLNKYIHKAKLCSIGFAGITPIYSQVL